MVVLKRWLIGLAAVVVLSPLAHAAETKADGRALLIRLVARSDDVQLQLDVLRGMHAALEGRRNVPSPDGWTDVYAKLGHGGNAELRTLARQLAAIYGDEQAIADMQKTLEDAKTPTDERRTVLRSLLA